MKILLVVPEYPPYHVGGGGEVYKSLAEGYTKLGHTVVVIYGYYPTESWSEELECTSTDGITFYKVPEIPYPKSMPFLKTAMPCTPKILFKLKRIIQNEKPDIAHVHGYGFILINSIVFILNRINIKYVFTIHGYPETQNKYSVLVRIFWNIYVKAVMNRTLIKAKNVTCISDYIRTDVRNICQNKSVTIYNGINAKEYTHVSNSIDIKKSTTLRTVRRFYFRLVESLR